MTKNRSRNTMRIIRHKRIRKHISGTSDVPRVSVFKSLANIHAQAIDDIRGVTLCSASSLELRDELPYRGNIEAAKQVGKILGERLRELGIKRIKFDRGGSKYHGRVKALADAMRECGIEF